MFDPNQEALVRAWNDGLGADVSLTVVVTGDERSERVQAFADALAALAPRVTVSTRHDASAEAPAILAGPVLRCLAAPGGTELAPFLEGAGQFGLAMVPPPDAPPAPAGADIRAYVSPHCPHCPAVTRELFRVAAAQEGVRLTIVDVDLFPDLASRDLVKSVPTVLIGRHYRATGTIGADEVRRALDRAEPDAAVLGRLLDGGDADAVAAMMAESRQVFPAILDRVADSTMTVRLGAMAALERLIDAAPDVARTAEAGLRDRVAGAGREAAGDLLYMLGEAGSPASAVWLDAFSGSTEDEELREAATDALARIAERTTS